jgi:hypothetical protein
MRNKFILCSFFLLFAFAGVAQQLPIGSCGIVNTYDPSGNRLRRLYFCNNGVDPYPLKTSSTIVTSKPKAAGQTISQPGFVDPRNPKVNWEFQSVDALYPNPTTGKFSVTFSKALSNAVIIITDVHGKTILRFTASGYKVDFDLSYLASGTYFVKINDAGNVIGKKVIKQ